MSGIVQGLLASFSLAAAVVTDTYFYLVTLLLNTTSTNGAQNNTFIDSSSNGYSITRNPATGPNAPTQGTFTPFSQTGWSNYFPTNTATSQTTLTSTVTAFGTGNFTIEFNYYLIAHAAGNVGQIYEGGTNGIGILVENTNQLRVFQRDGAGTSTTLIASGAGTAITANAWTYIALVRTGTGANQLTLYVNGSSVGTGTSSANYTSTTGYINGRYTGANYFPVICYISNLRVSTTNRTITVPTAFYTSDASTTLLTCISNRFINVVNGNDLTVLSTATVEPSVQSFSPFAPTAAYSTTTVGGSGYFDRSGDYLDVGSNANLTIGTSEFTIAFWAYFNVIDGTTQIIFEGRPSSAADNVTPTILYSSVTNAITVRVNGSNLLIGTASVTKAGQWYYLAVSRLSGTSRLFVNGAEQASAADTNTYVAFATDRPRIGDRGNSSGAGTAFGGYLSGLQVLIGTGYSSVTVPTAPPTNVANTQLLLNYTNAGIYDAAAKNDLETVGNAQVASGTYSPTATGTSGASTITVSSATGLKRGQSVTGTGIGTNAIVTNIVTTTVTLSVVNSGTVSGTMTFTDPSKFGTTSIYFDGASDWLDFPVRGADFASGDFTIDLWFYKLSTGGQRLVSARSNNDGLTLGVNSSNFLTAFYGDTTASGTIAGTTTIAINTWYYVALVRSSGTTTLYLNGSTEGTPTSWSAKSFTSTAYRIGSSLDSRNEHFYGYIDEVRFTKYARTITTPTAAFPVQ